MFNMFCVSGLSVEIMETVIVELTVVCSLQYNIHAFTFNIVKLGCSKNALL
jgi:hypothetical protein